MKLDDVYRQALDSPDAFERKRVLWIGSESYDAPAICVLEGLKRLDFEVHVLKPNINSWFCETVVEDPSRHKYDFVLSSLHWGTRWSHYDKFKLHGYPKVLIDGDDARPGQDDWRAKYDFWVETYGLEESEEVKAAEIAPRRWMEPLGGYRPDVVFTMQKQPGDKETHYIPSGIHERYLAMSLGKRLEERHIDIAHVPGPGVWRSAMSDLFRLGTFHGTAHEGPARGRPVYPPEIRGLAERDGDNVHSYHRWACWTAYYEILNHSKVFVHPGIDHLPFWDCPRIYEGMACGCLVTMSTPCTDVSDYPPTDVCPQAVFVGHEEMIRNAEAWYKDRGYLDDLRRKCYRRGVKFFAPVPVARYFLHKVRRSL
jgi:hypothetical protein